MNSNLFGQLVSPFAANTNIFTNNEIVTKVGFCYKGMFNFAPNTNSNNTIEIIITDSGNQEHSFYLGKTGILELEDILIKSIKFTNAIENENMTVNFQFATGDDNNESVFNQ